MVIDIYDLFNQVDELKKINSRNESKFKGIFAKLAGFDQQ